MSFKENVLLEIDKENSLGDLINVFFAQKKAVQVALSRIIIKKVDAPSFNKTKKEEEEEGKKTNEVQTSLFGLDSSEMIPLNLSFSSFSLLLHDDDEPDREVPTFFPPNRNKQSPILKSTVTNLSFSLLLFFAWKSKAGSKQERKKERKNNIKRIKVQ